MSGTLSILGGVAGILFGGSGPVTLGGVTLTGLATPERMPWGGRQQLVIHRMPGGGRVIDAMGPDEKPLEFSGYFQGPSASSQARQIDNMRQAGKPVSLAWGSFSRQVIISSFECESANAGFLLPYRASCEVVQAAPTGSGALGLLGALGIDVSGALSAVSDVVSPILTPVSAALSAVQSVIPLAGALTAGSSAFLGVQSALNGATSAVSVASGLADNGMGTIIARGNAAGNVLGATDAAGGISALLNAGTASGVLASVQQAAGYVGRMAANLAGASA